MLQACFDFSFKSDIFLPELHNAVAGGRPIVTIRTGTVAAALAGGVAVDASVQIAGDTALLSIPGVARYLIRGGTEIIVAPAAGSSERDVRLFLLGSALGFLCHQRGLLLLHANAVVLDDSAFAFAGPSSAGKSTLAAYFQRAGYPVLCDDVCAIRFDEAGRPFAWPGLPRLKLWKDSAEAFGYDPAGLDAAIEGSGKYHVPLPPRSAAKATRLQRLYLLERAASTGAGAVTRLQGVAAMEAVLANTYRGRYLAPMGLAGRHFRQCQDLLAHAEVYIAARRWGHDVFAREAARLERHMRGETLQREEA